MSNESSPSKTTVITVALVAILMLFQLFIIVKQHQIIVKLYAQKVLVPVEVVKYLPIGKKQCPTEEEIIEKVTTASMLQYLFKDVE